MDDYLSKPNKQPVLKTILKHWLPKTFSASQPDPKELKREEIKLCNFWCHITNRSMSKAWTCREKRKFEKVQKIIDQFDPDLKKMIETFKLIIKKPSKTIQW